MANRHLSRSIVVQTLYEWDFRGNLDIEEILKRNAEEFSSGSDDISFMQDLINSILEHQKELDTVITKAAPEWPIEKISIIDRNILRLGLNELIFSDHKDVPPKVAINEAIELAKSFGGDTSGRFINGVLGAVYKELGEPGKDQQSSKKKTIPYDEMEIETLGGAVVYAEKDGEIYLALVHDIFGHWTLSKGHIDKEENIEAGISRIVEGEMGIKAKVVQELGENEYVANDAERIKIRKQVKYFLAEAKYKTVKLGESGGLDDAQWFKLRDILDLNFYEDILPIVTKAVNLLIKDPDEAKHKEI